MRGALRIPLGVTLGLVLLAILLPSVRGGSEAYPEIPDPKGDVRFFDEVPAPVGALDNVDLLGAWVGNETPLGIDFSLRVQDLGALSSQTHNPGSSFGYSVEFSLHEANATGRAVRPGQWIAAAYPKGPQSPWGFYVEAPCKAFQPDGSCAGSDRDLIRENITGQVSMATNTITIHVPRDILENPQRGDFLGDLYAGASCYWPAFPAGFIDLAEAPQGTKFAFSSGTAQQGMLNTTTTIPPEGARTASLVPIGLPMIAVIALAALADRRRRANSQEEQD